MESISHIRALQYMKYKKEHPEEYSSSDSDIEPSTEPPNEAASKTTVTESLNPSDGKDVAQSTEPVKPAALSCKYCASTQHTTDYCLLESDFRRCHMAILSIPGSLSVKASQNFFGRLESANMLPLPQDTVFTKEVIDALIAASKPPRDDQSVA